MADETEKKIKKLKIEDMRQEGTQFIIPVGVNFDQAIDLLERRKKYEEEVTEIRENIDAFIWDGALALQKAIRKIYGFANAETIDMGFFGKEKPKMISVETSHNSSALVPWGRFTLPGIDGYIETGYTRKDGRIIFSFSAEVKRKFEGQVRTLAGVTRAFVEEESIYKGKPFKMRFFDDDGDRKSLPEPHFLDLSKVKENELIFPDEVDAAVSTSVYTPIEKSEECRKYKIPLKRGILLEGPYGTGKTLAAYVTAAKCVRNGWTFLYCEKADELDEMVKFAQHYQPAVVFCEDIDRVTSGERDMDMDDILNIIDGIEAKKTEIMIVLTTNHVETIHKAMLRPGRLDSVIKVLPPDAKAVQQLLRLYGRDMIPKNADLTKVGAELDRKIPAVIRECVERAKLSAIKFSTPGKALVLSPEALMDAAIGLRSQLELLADAKPVSKMHEAGENMSKALKVMSNGSDDEE